MTNNNCSLTGRISGVAYSTTCGVWAIVIDSDNPTIQGPPVFITGFRNDGIYADPALNDGIIDFDRDPALELLIDLLPETWPLFVTNNDGMIGHEYEGTGAQLLAEVAANTTDWGISIGGLIDYLPEHLINQPVEFEMDGREVVALKAITS